MRQEGGRGTEASLPGHSHVCVCLWADDGLAYAFLQDLLETFTEIAAVMEKL